jgi:hypothetical protein
METRLAKLEEGAKEATGAAARCRAEGRRAGEAATALGEEVRAVRARQEAMEREARKYFLLITKLRRTRRLERPGHVVALVGKFLSEQLEVEGVEVEEAYRVEGAARPQDIRVKFASMKDRNLVLAAGRKFK